MMNLRQSYTHKLNACIKICLESDNIEKRINQNIVDLPSYGRVDLSMSKLEVEFQRKSKEKDAALLDLHSFKVVLSNGRGST